MSAVNCEHQSYLTSFLSDVADQPDKPRNLKVTDVWKDYVTVGWEAPENDGGSPLMGYVVEQRDAFEVSYKFIGHVDRNVEQFQVCSP